MKHGIIESAFPQFIAGKRNFIAKSFNGFTVNFNLSLESNRAELKNFARIALSQIRNRCYCGNLTESNLDYLVSYLENYNEQEAAFMGDLSSR